MNRRIQAAATTKADILSAARAVFGSTGFADASLEAITSRANVTTGAIYHHFGGKQALFEAVAETVEQDILTAVLKAAASESDPERQLAMGMRAMLTQAAQGDVRQIVFIDAPAVFGPARWREVETRYAYGLMHQSLSTLSANSARSGFDPDIAAPVLLGALVEAARAVACAGDPVAAQRRAERILGAVLAGLLRH